MNALELRVKRAKRDGKRNSLNAILRSANERGGMSAADIATFDRLEAEINELTEAIRAGESISPEQRADVAAVSQKTSKESSMTTTLVTEVRDGAAKPGLRWYAGPDKGNVYRRDGQHSFFIDMAKLANQGASGHDEARKRLDQNTKLRADEERKLGLEQRTQPNTSNGTGGEFVPPLWLENDFIAFVRPGRVTANLFPSQPLPAGTDTINLPKILTGTATAQQIMQNSGVQETDLTTTSVASPVITIAGGQTVSLQLMEQSPLNIDSVILNDLAKAYAQNLDQLVISGTGTSGQPQGITTLSGIGTGSYTAATLYGASGIYAAIVNGIAAVNNSLYLPPDHIVMNPLTWAMMLVQTDTQDRPLILPAGNGNDAFNAFGVSNPVANAQGLVGWLGGLPVYTDPNFPSTNGEILLGRFAEGILWESDIRAEAFQQTYASNMSVYVRLYNYAAIQPGRYAQAWYLITGPAGTL
jgi:HK97 family phage major capsid protein